MMRVLPTARVSRQPATAAASSATARGKRPCREKKEIFVAPAFCARKTMRATRTRAAIQASTQVVPALVRGGVWTGAEVSGTAGPVGVVFGIAGEGGAIWE